MPTASIARNPAEYPPLRRGMLLFTLEAQFPHALTRDALLRPSAPFYVQDPGAFEKDLTYLALQGLIEEKEVDVPTRDLVRYAARRRAGNRVSFQTPDEIDAPTRKLGMVTITPKGINVIEGTLEDPGVLFAVDEGAW